MQWLGAVRPAVRPDAATKRLRDLRTAGLLRRISALTCVLALPAPRARMTRARKATACAELGRRTHIVSCSWARKITSGIGRPKVHRDPPRYSPEVRGMPLTFLMTQDARR